MMRRLLATAALAACLVLAGSGRMTREPLRVLELNLCASGRAACYTGQSIDRAVAVLRETDPDVVTLNEVCAAHVTHLADGYAYSAFQAAPDRPSNGPTRCRDGQPYGVALLAREPGTHRTYRGVYPVQDLRDPEERVWLCLGAERYYACTTHLASTDATVARAQCGHLMGTTIPNLHRRDGDRPTVVGGDLNLPEACVPAGYHQFDAGGLLHLMASVPLRSPTAVDMRRTTDHQGLLATIFVDHK